jgi:HSP20 family molecular chaperone IbpA
MIYFYKTANYSYNGDSTLTTSQGDSEYQFNLAGTDKKDISLSADNGILEVKVKEEVVKNVFVGNDFDDIEATYNNGMLTVKFTKDKSPPKKIKIK